MTFEKVKRIFYISAACLLFGTAFLKIFSAMLPSGYLSLPDPVLSFLTTRQMFLLVATMEFILGSLLFFGNDSWPFKPLLTFWFAALAVIYRLGLLWMDIYTCPCFGKATDWLKISEQTAARVAWVILCYFFISSIAIVLGNYFSHRRAAVKEVLP